jgi:hypothetical protein
MAATICLALSIKVAGVNASQKNVPCLRRSKQLLLHSDPRKPRVSSVIDRLKHGEYIRSRLSKAELTSFCYTLGNPASQHPT